MSRKKNRTNELRPDPRNARRHGDRNKQLIRASIDELGAGRSILLGGDNTIIAGNGVHEQALAAGLKVRIVDGKPDELIAVRRKDLTGKRATRMALLDNRAGELAEWDEEVIGQISEATPELLEGLWTGEELAELIGGEQETPPTEFKQVDETIETDHQCPKCGYRFSGGT